MKTICLIIVGIISFTLINCGSSDSKRAVTPNNCVGANCDFVGTTTLNSSLRTFTSSHIQFLTDESGTSTKDRYEDLVKGTFGICDVPSLPPGLFYGQVNEIDILNSILMTSALRCSKMTDRAFLGLKLKGNQATFDYIITSSHFTQVQIAPIVNKTVNIFRSAVTDQTFTANLADGAAHRTNLNGVEFDLVGNINSNFFEIYIVHFGKDVAKFSMNRTQ